MLTGKSSSGVVLERFELYSTKAHYYLVGHDKAATAFKLLKLSRLEAELEATEDPCTYTKDECTALLRRVRDGNARIGGLQFVCKVRVDAAHSTSRSHTGQPCCQLSLAHVADFPLSVDPCMMLDLHAMARLSSARLESSLQHQYLDQLFQPAIAVLL